jgi:hypothetical protein
MPDIGDCPDIQADKPFYPGGIMDHARVIIEFFSGD